MLVGFLQRLEKRVTSWRKRHALIINLTSFPDQQNPINYEQQQKS